MYISFKPEPWLLDEIDCRQRIPLIFIFETVEKAKKGDPYRDPYSIGLVGVLKAMQEMYKEKFTQRESHELFVYCFSEPLRNAMEHGNQFQAGKQVATAIWFGQKGVTLAFRDEGDYFSRPEIKQRYENRESNPTTRSTGVGGHGTKGLKKYANSILVATDQNTLYINYLLSSEPDE